MKHDNQYISIVDSNNRTSTLDLGYDSEITVIGVLPHGSIIQPKTVKDAQKLIVWLNKWIDDKDFNDSNVYPE